MDHVDYYKLLEIPKAATAAAIKTAYRKLARKYHPDLNPGNKESEKNFKEINEANEVLSDPKKRKQYDEHGNDWKHADEFEKANEQQNPFQGKSNQQYTDQDYSDLFGSMFGSGGQHQQTKFRGQNLNAEITLNLSSVYQSQQQTITVNGKNIRLTYPAGIENGQIVKIKGHGSPGSNSGPNGDLYITFSIKNDTRFKRDGKDLYVDQEIDLYTAILGGEVQIATFDGKVKLKVPTHTQPGTKIKLKGKGFPVYKKDAEYGDLFITYKVKLPTNLSPKQNELFQEIRSLADGE